LDQVMTNLIENAARHSPEGGRVTVRAAAAIDVIVISVSDEGPGIPSELRDVVLEPFRGATASGSTGIGLAICRSIIEAHDGTITVDDEPGGGAQISFVLPIDASFSSPGR
jgi:signal transduction histidine kinase